MAGFASDPNAIFNFDDVNVAMPNDPIGGGEGISTAIDEGEEPESMADGTQSGRRRIPLVDPPESQPSEAATGKKARRRRKLEKTRDRAFKNADEIAAAEDSPDGSQLQRATRRKLAFSHGSMTKMAV
ncbi:hypothetical protein MMC31_005686 [Peltigera leucophlebia]|nr:hypothetical protein [Peltigera leucophlebia]